MNDPERLSLELHTLREENELLRKAVEEYKEKEDLPFQRVYGLQRSVFDNTIVQITVVEPVREKDGKISDFKILLVNGQFERETKRLDLVEKLWGKEYPGICETEIFETMVNVMETGITASIECYYPFDGFNNWFSYQFVKNEDCLICTMLDITPRKHKEEEIEKSTWSRHKEIMDIIFSTQEEERQRIGETLHNGVAQLLYGIQTRLEMLEKNPPNEEKIKELLSITADAIKDIRNLSFELVPAVLKDFGLETGLKSLFQRIIREDLVLDLRIKGSKQRLPESFELTIYRITQELVNNVIKHAKATEVRVVIEIKPANVTICVKDNGIGFDVTSIDMNNAGIGLQSVRNRIMLLDGTISIENEVPGTEIQIRLPRKK